MAEQATMSVQDLILDAETLKAIQGTTRNDLIEKRRRKTKSVPEFRTSQIGPHAIVVTRSQGGRDRWQLAIDGEEGSVILRNLTKGTSVRVTEPAELTPFFRNVKEPIETGSRWLPELYPAMIWRRALLTLLTDTRVREAVRNDLFLMEGEGLSDHRYPQCPNTVTTNGATDDWGKRQIPWFNESLCKRLASAVPWHRRHLETRGKVTELEIRWVTHLAPALDILASHMGVAWVRVWLEEAAKATFDLGHPAAQDYSAHYVSRHSPWANPAGDEIEQATKAIFADLAAAGYDTYAPDPTLAGWLVREATRQGYAETPLRFMAMWAQCLRWQTEAWGAIVDERPRDVRSKTLAAAAHARAASMDALARRAQRLAQTIEAAPLEKGVSAFALEGDADIRRDALGLAAMTTRQDGSYSGSIANPYLSAVLSLPGRDVDVLAIDVDDLHLRAFLPASADAIAGAGAHQGEPKGHPLDQRFGTTQRNEADGVWAMTPTGSARLTNALHYTRSMRHPSPSRKDDTIEVDGIDAASLKKALRAYGTILKARLEALGLQS